MTLDEFTPSANTWAGRSPPNTANNAPLAVGHPNGRVYVIGGWFSLSTNEEYDPIANSWRSRQGMAVSRAAPAGAAGSDGRIYVFGGTNGQNLDAAEAYDPVTNTWETLPSMPVARHAAAAVAFGDRILVFGGSITAGGSVAVASTIVHFYDIGARSWGSLAPMPTDRSDFGAATLPDGRVIMVGGYSGDTGRGGRPSVVDAYCPLKNQWNVDCAPPTPTPTNTATSTPTLTPTPTATPGVCAPRPPVALQTTRPAFGQLSVVVTAGTSPSTPSNWLRRIRFDRLDNARVTIRTFTNQEQPFVVDLPERPRQVAFSATWKAQGPYTIHLTVEDDCNPPWRTFVGAGERAF